MITRVFLLTFLSASVAVASDRLDRLETISEELTQLLYQAMVNEIAAGGADVTKLREAIPNSDWNQPMREAAQCVLEQYQQKIGSEGVDKMLDDMEASLPELREGGMAAMEKNQDLQPEGISEDEAISINESCGMADLMQENMMAGEFMSEFMKLMGGN